MGGVGEKARNHPPVEDLPVSKRSYLDVSGPVACKRAGRRSRCIKDRWAGKRDIENFNNLSSKIAKEWV